ncbi:ribosome maturation factor RimM [Salinicoccus sp. ID82-1]|uniref:ribosome maturation factor RimM n=1 Tax=Salinicoccus sp. ID82-1 TaxID=2820269 RepID=UPI001EEDB42F|nr:ribosome maturation factor RimM [Salinicoccus sp. ID82-1]MCG1008704.1 ribosome maturation factor RimM [Salinicoccus sp. ID82-1]
MKISIGRLVNFHGIRGEVKVLSDSDFAEDRFSPGSSVEVKGTSYTIDSYRKHKNFHMLKFKGVGNINEVEHLKGSDVLQEAEAVDVPLEEGEYHYRDIIGLDVLLEETLEPIGTVSDIFETGANDVWVVDGDRQYMIPYIEDVVKDIDLERGHIIIHPMEGLLD